MFNRVCMRINDVMKNTLKSEHDESGNLKTGCNQKSDDNAADNPAFSYMFM